MSEQRTELNDLGEFGLIERISKQFKLNQASSVYGIGDDAAVIDAGNHYQLISTDMLVEGVHFDLSYVPLQHLGFKAVAVNVSDIAAMNGRAEQVVVSLGLSNRFSVEAVDVFYDGVKAACDQFGVDLVGGDITSSRSGFLISIAVNGWVDKDKVVYRNGAGEKDIICVTGDLGGAYMGLNVLERNKKEFMANPDMQPDLKKYEYMVGRQLRPIARQDIIFELNDLGVLPTSMIDVSDGLASELHHLSRQSGRGVSIYEDKVPIDNQTYEAAVEFKIDPYTAALNGGEDYELLFTISPDDHDKLKNHADIHFIGHMQEKDHGLAFVTKKGNVYPLQAQGWKHL